MSFALLITAPSVSKSVCIGEAAKSLSQLETTAFSNPARAIQDIQELIRGAMNAQTLSITDHAAALAIMGEAYRQLDQVSPALESANAGIALIDPRTHSPLGVRLRLLRALMLDDNNQNELALKELNELIREEADAPLAIACVKKDRGWIRETSGDMEGAIRDLNDSYSYLRRSGPESEAMVAAGRLAALYRMAGEHDLARPLLLQSLSYFQSIRAWVRVSTAYERLGQLDLAQSQPIKALDSFSEMKKLAMIANDAGGVAYADLDICQALASMNQFQAALEHCAIAEAGLRGIDKLFSSDLATLEHSYARIETGQSRHALAAKHYAAAIASNAVELRGQLGSELYEGYAFSEGALGHYRQAYHLLQEHLRIVHALNSEKTVRTVASLRMQFDQERQQSKHSALAKERSLLLESNTRATQAHQLQIAWLATFCICAVTLIWIFSKKEMAEGERRAADRRLAELGHLSAGVAQEFNNLMTVIHQSAGLLMRQTVVRHSRESRAMVDAIRDVARSGGAITQQLLAFGRQQHLKPQLIICQDFLVQLEPRWQHSMANDVTCIVASADALLTVYADPHQLAQALSNLVINACEACAASGLIICSVRPSEPHSKETVFSVSDNGSGMSEAVLEHCTEAFFTTKQAGCGVGLGLSAVQGFATQSGGRFAVRSVPAKGTVASITLPSRPTQQPPDRA